MQNINIIPGFNDAIFDALKVKINAVDGKQKCFVLVFDEMSLKLSIVYNNVPDKIEGFEDLGDVGSSDFVADLALVIMERSFVKVETTSWLLPYSRNSTS